MDFFSILDNHFYVDKDLITFEIRVESDIRETEINIPADDKGKVRSI